MKKQSLLLLAVLISFTAFTQNVGIGIITPASKLHIKGSADTTQLIIDANSTQSNTNPLIKLRNSFGSDLMWIHSDDTTNSFVGLGAGRVNNATGGGKSNTFMGSRAGYSNTTGYDNTANGELALFSNTTGYANTANGLNALYSNTTGYTNTANGLYALFHNTTGYANTANGELALFSNTTGVNNTAIGLAALKSNTTGQDNTANGYEALFNNSAGNDNIANGYEALFSNATGVNNTAMGSRALVFNNSNNNTAFGYNSLLSNTTGDGNTSAGYQSMYANDAGFQNTAVGFQSLYTNNANRNVGIGTQALYNNTTGTQNVAIGAYAGYNYPANQSCTFIGYGADASTSLANSTGIGNGAVVNADNKIRLGNNAVTVIEGNVGFTTSDGRFKKNVKDNVPGLDFIKALRPVTYQYKSFELDQFLLQNSPVKAACLKRPDYQDAERMIHMGFIAQEVEQVVKDKGYQLNLVKQPANNADNYSLAYSELIAPLVKAVQELADRTVVQQQIIETQKNDIETLKTHVAELTKTVNALMNK